MGKKDKAIDDALAALEKRFGSPMVQKMSNSRATVKTQSSGRPSLDSILGGGYGTGKIIEIYGESGSGKTGLALEAIRSVQEAGGIAAIVDAEHALNTDYCNLIGINVDDLYISQPDCGEQAFEVIRALINTHRINLIVVDSVAAMVPRAELEGESGEAKIALQARMMSQGMKLITGSASNAECTVIFLNQLRKTIAMYGPSETTTGGKALKFYSTQRLEVKNKGILKESQEVIGFKQHIKVVKNKIASPFKTIEFDIAYDKGVDTLTGLIEALEFEEILKKAGGWYSYKDTNIANGKKKLRSMLEDNPELLEELEAKLKEIRRK